MVGRAGPRGVRLAVLGSRSFPRLDLVDAYVDLLPLDFVVVSGGGGDVDLRAERRARARGMAVDIYPAAWKRLGKRAGPLRTEQLLRTVGGLASFWDEGPSPGTLHGLCFAIGDLHLPVRLTLASGRVLWPSAAFILERRLSGRYR